MDLNDHRGRFGGSGKKFNLSHIVGDPFSLATLGIAVGGWLIAFVSSIITDLDQEYPNYAWWTLVYTFFCIVGIFVTVATDSVFTYHVAIVGFMAAALVFCTSSVNALIYYSEGSKEAASAGFILLSMVSIVWIFYYGSQPQASHRQTMASFALHKEHVPSRNSRHMTQSFRPDTVHSTGPQQMYGSNALAGFETSSPTTALPTNNTPNNRYSEVKRESVPMFQQPNQPQPLSTQSSQQQLQSQQQQQQQQQQTIPGFTAPQQQPMPMPENQVSAPSEYPYRAKAIYSYEANPDDPNEISFNKHEILDVSDVSGRWWQAKKANGETGIAPSNYLILL